MDICSSVFCVTTVLTDDYTVITVLISVCVLCDFSVPSVVSSSQIINSILIRQHPANRSHRILKAPDLSWRIGIMPPGKWS